LLSWGDNVRMSLAGAQDKAALYLKDGDFYLPMNGAPSNVILKVGINDFSINEFVTTCIAGLLGLDVPEEEIRFIRDKACLLTKRFDREEKDGTIHRIHQEDMCQASAVVPENKYEENGGPGISKITSILALASSKPINDLRKMAKAVVFNFLFGNCDAHAKNFSLLYPLPGSSPVLAPFYDLTCTTIYPELSRNMAMRLGGEKRIDRIMKNQELWEGKR
ncbi:MAG: HipA domain-containing protein, partial [Candidatus Ornithospirochaeta sp.]